MRGGGPTEVGAPLTVFPPTDGLSLYWVACVNAP